MLLKQIINNNEIKNKQNTKYDNTVVKFFIVF